MEPTIYKPSIYKGAGIYKAGAGGIGPITPELSTIELFGKTYNTIIIDGLETIRENLDYKWAGLSIGLSNAASPGAAYVNNDESIWGWNGRKCGLLYNFEAQRHLQNYELTNGWRVMTIDDLGKLLSYIQGNDYFKYGLSLVKNETWATMTGDNQILLDILPCGAAIGDGSGFYQIGEAFYINMNAATKTMAYCRDTESFRVGVGNFSSTWFTPIRLCRDVV